MGPVEAGRGLSLDRQFCDYRLRASAGGEAFQNAGLDASAEFFIPFTCVGKKGGARVAFGQV